ncbi:membrane protein [Amylibacter marinus]|uniref:Probable membrane transporter protein n=1 Tax=Amylibacter marinus TaxID=1475483 RepID=A0ABQ5VTN7_9RHOB|nr:sulfite exporter TauE/SafE family protein [Amylibacter marinus]GLQ34695.1 membrane protein [Amylibacter marinus]
MPPDITLVVAAASFFLAGAIKGLVGLGLPSAAIAFMLIAIEPRTAIALVIFPMLGTNVWQSYRAGEFLRTARRYWVFAVILFCCVGATSYLTRDIPDRGLIVVLGIGILIFVVASWRDLVPPIPARYDRHAQVGFSLFAGLIGGMTAGWGPPMAMYLTSARVKKDEFIRATGFLILAGSFPLLISYTTIGFMQGDLALVSMAMVIPTILGFSIGEKIRTRLSAAQFHNAILCLFALLALNMFRRAIWYV